MSSLDERLAAAQTAFQQALADTRRHVARVAATPVHTAEQRARLEDDALAGRLGQEMRELAERVAARETTWGEVFDGTSPHAGLLVPHVSRMQELYADQWRAVVRADPDFDRTVETP